MKSLTHQRRGFTLVELIVVIAVIVVVLAIVTPAIREARDRVKSVRCRNNLKQIGLALHNYNEVYGAFPPGYVAATRVSPKDESRELNWNSGWGWQTMVLPFVDQAPLFNKISGSNGFSLGLPTAVDKITTTKIPAFRCGEDKGSAIVEKVTVLGPLPKDRVTAIVEKGFARSNYVGVAGWENDWHLGAAVKEIPNADAAESVSNWSEQKMGHDFRDGIAIYAGPLKMTGKPPCPNARDSHGIFGENSSRKFNQLIDGTSNCFIVGERATPTASSAETDVGNVIWAGVPDRSTRVGQALSLGTAHWPINHELTADTVPNTTGFNSRHGGGANFLVADGSVRSVAEKLDLAILRRLAIVDDGAIIPAEIPAAP